LEEKAMKRLIIIIILMLIFTVSALDVAITGGYQLKLTDDFLHSPIYVRLDIWQDISIVRLYGSYTNEMWFTGISFAPTQDYFTFGAMLSLPHVQIKLERMCQHPVVSRSEWSGLHGGHNKIEVTISNKRMLY
jgi:hypothetical protein